MLLAVRMCELGANKRSWGTNACPAAPAPPAHPTAGVRRLNGERRSQVSLCASRWWAWTLIKGLSPEEALQVRAKVASLEALKGQRADLGLQRAWEGNYLVSWRSWWGTTLIIE